MRRYGRMMKRTDPWPASVPKTCVNLCKVCAEYATARCCDTVVVQSVTSCAYKPRLQTSVSDVRMALDTSHSHLHDGAPRYIAFPCRCYASSTRCRWRRSIPMRRIVQRRQLAGGQLVGTVSAMQQEQRAGWKATILSWMVIDLHSEKYDASHGKLCGRYGMLLKIIQTM